MAAAITHKRSKQRLKIIMHFRAFKQPFIQLAQQLSMIP